MEFCILRIKSRFEQESQTSKPSKHGCLEAYEYAFPNGLQHWFVDSECSTHITYDRSAFTSYSTMKISVVSRMGCLSEWAEQFLTLCARIYNKSIRKPFSAESMATALYVRNQVTTLALPDNTTSYHIWHGKAPGLSHIRVIGSQCWYVLPSSN